MIDLTNLFERCYIHLALKKYLLYIFDLFLYLNSISCNASCDSIVTRYRSAASVRSTEVKRHNAVTSISVVMCSLNMDFLTYMAYLKTITIDD